MIDYATRRRAGLSSYTGEPKKESEKEREETSKWEATLYSWSWPLNPVPGTREQKCSVLIVELDVM